jgi:putative FmdB family regulatory protein
MPTYDYRCPNGHDFEHFYRKISDATAELACPQCGTVAERRLSAGAGLVFKGSGFYLTDYGKNAHRKAGGETSGGDSRSDSSGDSTPAKSESGKADASSAGTSKPEGTSSGASKSESKKSEGTSSSKPKGDAT